MLKFLRKLFSRQLSEPRGWPWSHREWEGVEIPNVGIVVGWDVNVPGRLLCFTREGKFVNYDLPDYRSG